VGGEIKGKRNQHITRETEAPIKRKKERFDEGKKRRQTGGYRKWGTARQRQKGGQERRRLGGAYLKRQGKRADRLCGSGGGVAKGAKESLSRCYGRSPYTL